MTNFEIAHKFTSIWEGDLSDHPSDPGGITKYGVSLRWLRSLGHQIGDIDKNGDIDKEDILALTGEQAAELFQSRFWLPYKLDSLPQITAVLHYDCMINTGPHQSALLTQRACNRLMGSYGTPIVVDGVFGPKTRAFLCSNSTTLLYNLLIEERKKFYISLANSKPSLVPFLKGWINRCKAIHKYIEELDR